MKKIKFLSLLTISFLMAATSFSQTADEIVSKHIEAIGGAENWKKINTCFKIRENAYLLIFPEKWKLTNNRGPIRNIDPEKPRSFHPFGIRPE